MAKFAEWEGRDEGAEDEPRPPEVIEEARDTLQSLAERMAKSEPEDFELVRNEGSCVGKVLLLGSNCTPLTGQIGGLFLEQQCWPEEQGRCPAGCRLL